VAGSYLDSSYPFHRIRFPRRTIYQNGISSSILSFLSLGIYPLPLSIECWVSGITPHLVFDVNCGGDSEFEIYEGAVVSGGTPFTAINRHRSVGSTSQSASLINPTITSTGTALTGEFLAGGSGGGASGASAYSFQYVLAPLTTYLFRLTNRSGQAHMAHIMIEWYE